MAQTFLGTKWGSSPGASTSPLVPSKNYNSADVEDIDDNRHYSYAFDLRLPKPSGSPQNPQFPVPSKPRFHIQILRRSNNPTTREGEEKKADAMPVYTFINVLIGGRIARPGKIDKRQCSVRENINALQTSGIPDTDNHSSKFKKCSATLQANAWSYKPVDRVIDVIGKYTKRGRSFCRPEMP